MGVLEDTRNRMHGMALEVAEKLATRGAVEASSRFRSAAYTGDNDTQIDVVRTSDGWSIEATGKSVLFIEFGSGVRYGYGHPQAGEFGFGPGTWSEGPNGRGMWDNEKGWYTPDREHTYGNPPAMAMYHASRAIKNALPEVFSEVFHG